MSGKDDKKGKASQAKPAASDSTTTSTAASATNSTTTSTAASAATTAPTTIADFDYSTVTVDMKEYTSHNSIKPYYKQYAPYEKTIDHKLTDEELMINMKDRSTSYKKAFGGATVTEAGKEMLDILDMHRKTPNSPSGYIEAPELTCALQAIKDKDAAQFKALLGSNNHIPLGELFNTMKTLKITKDDLKIAEKELSQMSANIAKNKVHTSSTGVSLD